MRKTSKKDTTSESSRTLKDAPEYPTYGPTGIPGYRVRPEKIVRLIQGKEVREYFGKEWVGIHADDLHLMAYELDKYDPEFRYTAQFFLSNHKKTHPKWPLDYVLYCYTCTILMGIKRGLQFKKWDFYREKNSE